MGNNAVVVCLLEIPDTASCALRLIIWDCYVVLGGSCIVCVCGILIVSKLCYQSSRVLTNKDYLSSGSGSNSLSDAAKWSCICTFILISVHSCSEGKIRCTQGGKISKWAKAVTNHATIFLLWQQNCVKMHYGLIKWFFTGSQKKPCWSSLTLPSSPQLGQQFP